VIRGTFVNPNSSQTLGASTASQARQRSMKGLALCDPLHPLGLHHANQHTDRKKNIAL
jgi:hypothetical protein